MGKKSFIQSCSLTNAANASAAHGHRSQPQLRNNSAGQGRFWELDAVPSVFLPSAGAVAKLSVKMLQHGDPRSRALVTPLATGPDAVTDYRTSTYKDSTVTQFSGWVIFTVVLSSYGEAVLRGGRSSAMRACSKWCGKLQVMDGKHQNVPSVP